MSTQALLVMAGISTSFQTCTPDHLVRICRCSTIQRRRGREWGQLHTGKNVVKSRLHSKHPLTAGQSSIHHHLCKAKLSLRRMQSLRCGTCRMAQCQLQLLCFTPISSRSKTQIPLQAPKSLKLYLLHSSRLVHQSRESPLRIEFSLLVGIPKCC